MAGRSTVAGMASTALLNFRHEAEKHHDLRDAGAREALR